MRAARRDAQKAPRLSLRSGHTRVLAPPISVCLGSPVERRPAGEASRVRPRGHLTAARPGALQDKVSPAGSGVFRHHGDRTHTSHADGRVYVGVGKTVDELTARISIVAIVAAKRGVPNLTAGVEVGGHEGGFLNVGEENRCGGGQTFRGVAVVVGPPGGRNRPLTRLREDAHLGRLASVIRHGII